MTGKSGAEDGVLRREVIATASAAAVVGGSIGTATPAAAAPANEICRMDAVTLAKQIRTKQLSATEVTEAVLARMEKLNPVLGAFCTPSPDVARAQAKGFEPNRRIKVEEVERVAAFLAVGIVHDGHERFDQQLVSPRARVRVVRSRHAVAAKCGHRDQDERRTRDDGHREDAAARTIGRAAHPQPRHGPPAAAMHHAARAASQRKGEHA